VKLFDSHCNIRLACRTYTKGADMAAHESLGGLTGISQLSMKHLLLVCLQPAWRKPDGSWVPSQVTTRFVIPRSHVLQLHCHVAEWPHRLPSLSTGERPWLILLKQMWLDQRRQIEAFSKTCAINLFSVCSWLYIARVAPIAPVVNNCRAVACEPRQHSKQSDRLWLLTT
jgi:hypothetical protein